MQGTQEGTDFFTAEGHCSSFQKGKRLLFRWTDGSRTQRERRGVVGSKSGAASSYDVIEGLAQLVNGRDLECDAKHPVEQVCRLTLILKLKYAGETGLAI